MQQRSVDVEPMTLQEYFSQGDFYWSESQQEAYEVARMPYPYVVNAVKKLIRDYGDEFIGCILYQTMVRKACPNTNKMISLFGNGITVGYWLGAPDARKKRTIRANAIKAANTLDLVLKFEVKDDVLYMQPDRVPNITVRGK